MKEISFEKAVELTESIYLNKLYEKYPNLNFCVCCNCFAVVSTYELVDREKGFSLLEKDVVDNALEDILYNEDEVLEVLSIDLKGFYSNFVFVEDELEALKEYNEIKLMKIIEVEKENSTKSYYISKSNKFYFISFEDSIIPFNSLDELEEYFAVEVIEDKDFFSKVKDNRRVG